MHRTTPLVLATLVLLSARPTFAATCQELADTHAIVHGVSFGTAGADVQALWKAQGCSARPSAARAPSLCQELSDTFWIIAGASWGTAPDQVQKSWVAIGCGATPTVFPVGRPTRLMNAAPPTLCLDILGKEVRQAGATADLTDCTTTGSGPGGLALDTFWTPRPTDSGYVQLVSSVDRRFASACRASTHTPRARASRSTRVRPIRTATAIGASKRRSTGPRAS